MVRLWADHSCGLSIVETEQAAEALTPLHVGVRAYRRWRSLQVLVVESLVVALTLIMLDVLVNDEPQCPSPSGTTRWRHSSLIDRTNRSA